jgi:hypothetical protein
MLKIKEVVQQNKTRNTATICDTHPPQCIANQEAYDSLAIQLFYRRRRTESFLTLRAPTVKYKGLLGDTSASSRDRPTLQTRSKTFPRLRAASGNRLATLVHLGAVLRSWYLKLIATSVLGLTQKPLPPTSASCLSHSINNFGNMLPHTVKLQSDSNLQNEEIKNNAFGAAL